MDMKTQRKLLWLLPLLLGMNVKVCIAAPTPDKMSLCDLQRTAKQGEQRSVQVGGVTSLGTRGVFLLTLPVRPKVPGLNSSFNRPQTKRRFDRCWTQLDGQP